ncbi:MAG: hypothetical protein HQK92_14435 [Nitrospirae bacterium]|nr:hypothetical protein [Nitrospirota bacterium]
MAILEKELITSFKAIFNGKDNMHEEVAFGNRCIDMVLVRDSVITTIEFKINNWRKALTQIEDHLLVADFSYLCMPKKRISEELLTILRKNGIGLWHYDFEVNELIEVVKPDKASYQFEFYKNAMLEKLSKRSN